MEDKVPHAAGRGLLPAPAPASATMAAGLPLAIWTAVLFLWQHFSRNTSEGAWCCAKTREAASPPHLCPLRKARRKDPDPSPASLLASLPGDRHQRRCKELPASSRLRPCRLFSLPLPSSSLSPLLSPFSLPVPGHGVCWQLA